MLFSAIRDSDNKGKVVDVIMPVTEIDRANMIFERMRYTGQPEQARQDAPSKEQEARVGQEAPQREQQRPQQGETPVTPHCGQAAGGGTKRKNLGREQTCQIPKADRPHPAAGKRLPGRCRMSGLRFWNG